MGATFSLRYLIAAMLLIVAGGASAQIQKDLRFIPDTLNFGNIRESDGPVTKTVKAVNISTKPTFIISARTSCGCSQAEYDGRQMQPGDTTIIKITYDPTNRPGKFMKTAKIFTGNDRINNQFRIVGTVIPNQQQLDKVYPDKAGKIRLSSKFVAVGDMKRDQTKPVFIGIYNDSGKKLVLSAESESDAIEAHLRPELIKPFDVTTLSMMVRGKDFPTSAKDFNCKVDVKDSETGELIISIPVMGAFTD